jgi:hypothetical protein
MGSLEEIASATTFQNSVPAGVYGRVLSLFLWAGSAGALVGGVAGPALADVLGTGRAILLLAIPDLALALVFALWAGNWLCSSRQTRMLVPAS